MRRRGLSDRREDRPLVAIVAKLARHPALDCGTARGGVSWLVLACGHVGAGTARKRARCYHCPPMEFDRAALCEMHADDDGAVFP